MNFAFAETERDKPCRAPCKCRAAGFDRRGHRSSMDSRPRHRPGGSCPRRTASPRLSGLRPVRTLAPHVGAPAGGEPFIVIGATPPARRCFVWPLVRKSAGRCQVATYFCGRHANSGTTLCGARRCRADIQRSRHARVHPRSRRCEPDIDALALHNQPDAGTALPIRCWLLPHQPRPTRTASCSTCSWRQPWSSRFPASMRHARNFDARSAISPSCRAIAMQRANIGRRRRPLASRFHEAEGARRLPARGIDNAFDEPGIEAFLRAACQQGLAGGQPLIEIHALECDGEMLALFAGIHDDQCFSTMFNSYTLGHARAQSPGLTLLQHLVDDCARRGFRRFDISDVGAAATRSSLLRRTSSSSSTASLALTARAASRSTDLRAMTCGQGHDQAQSDDCGASLQALRAKLFARKADRVSRSIAHAAADSAAHRAGVPCTSITSAKPAAINCWRADCVAGSARSVATRTARGAMRPADRARPRRWRRHRSPPGRRCAPAPRA